MWGNIQVKNPCRVGVVHATEISARRNDHTGKYARGGGRDPLPFLSFPEDTHYPPNNSNLTIPVVISEEYPSR